MFEIPKEDYILCVDKRHSEKKDKDYYALILKVEDKEIILSFIYQSDYEFFKQYLS